MWSTCSIETGHSCTHAPHVTQSQTTSSVTAPGTSGDASPPASTAGPSAKSRSRRPMIRSFGESALPVAQAGQTSWQRPHSVQDSVSSICFHVMSASVPEPNRSAASSSTSKSSGSRRPRCARPPEPDVEAGGRDVQVLRVRQVRRGSRGSSGRAPRRRCARAPRATRPCSMSVEIAFETGDHASGHSSIPSAIRDACQRRSVVTISAIRPRIRSASPRWLPSNRAGRCTLRIRNADDDADEHEDAEEVDEEEEPPLVPEPRQRPVGVDGAEERHDDRREEDDEAPEDEGVDQPGAEALEELPLPEDDRRLVAHPAADLAGAVDGLPEPDDPVERGARAARRGLPATPSDDERARPRRRPCSRRAHDDRAARIAADSAGRISCMSPITA